MITSGFIKERLNWLRQKLARHALLCGWLRASILILGVGFLLLLIEGWRYYPAAVRQQIAFYYLMLVIILFFIPLIFFFLIKHNRLYAYNDLQLAKRIGEALPEIKDTLLNALQLEALLNQNVAGFSPQLIERTLQQVAAQLAGCDLSSLVPVAEKKHHFRQLAYLVVALAITWILFPTHFNGAIERFTHPKREYAVPLPFEIQSLTGSRAVLGGDSLTLKFACRGRYPERLTLSLQYPEYTQRQLLMPDSAGNAVFILQTVRHDLIYEAYAENRAMIKSWRRISSGADTIRVINRPEILGVRFTINFPAYTRLPMHHQESNNPEILVYKGSTLTVEVTANKPISGGSLHFAVAPQLDLTTHANRGKATFKVLAEDDFFITIFDEQQITNHNPLQYRLRIQADNYPVVNLLNPKSDFDLTEAMSIPIGIRISDDFGFSRAAIVYRLIKNYQETQPSEYDVPFPIRDLEQPLQELNYIWKVGELNLAPEDAVEFRVEVYDNDFVSGPKKGVSATVRARFPSLNELFAAANVAQEEVFDQSSEIADQLKQTQQVLEQVARELLKKPAVSWEQKKQLEAEIRKTEQAAEKLEQLGQKIEAIIQSAKENQLWTPETLAKYAQLQQAFQEIMTPELRDALRQLQQALEKMDSQAVKKALDNFKINQQQFSQELDRMLQIFKRIKIEQAVDELARRFSDLAQRQQALDSTLNRSTNDQKQLERLAEEQETIRRDTEIARDIMGRTAKEMEEYPNLPHQELAALQQEMDKREIIPNQRAAQQALQQGSKNNATTKTKQSAKDLQRLAEQMQAYLQEFTSRSLEEVMTDFQRLLNKVLQLSQLQERLQKQIAQTPRQSEQVMEVAVKQDELYQSLGNVLNELIQLSNKTFGVTPRIGKGMGEAAGSMRRTVENLEERNVGGASNQANKTAQALNRVAIEVLAAMKQLKESGSASGFENYLKQLQQLSGAQQGLNQETEMLGLGDGGDQLTLQRLAARQQQLKQSLEQLQQEMSGYTKQGGNLGGIVQDMEEVIQDLKNNQVLRRTIERQQRILSRLLDAQQSLRTQDYKEERVSTTGQEMVRPSPADLPANLGMRYNLLQQNLEKALRDGYRREYQDLIRRYFEKLRQETNRDE